MLQEYLVTESQLSSEIKELEFEGAEQKTKEVNNALVLSFTVEGENEDSAKKLSAIHQIIQDKFSFVVLSNGCSEYFNKSLFPYINEFERKLRKLLYLAATLTGEEKIKGIENIRNLEEKELGEIFSMLFTDPEFNKRTRAIAKEVPGQYSKNWIVNYIQSFDESTLWDSLLGDGASLLREGYLEVKNARNDVMHAHNVSFEKYVEIKRNIKKINYEIDKLINSYTAQEETPIRLTDFNKQLSEVMASNTWRRSETLDAIYLHDLNIINDLCQSLEEFRAENGDLDTIARYQTQIETCQQLLWEHRRGLPRKQMENTDN